MNDLLAVATTQVNMGGNAPVSSGFHINGWVVGSIVLLLIIYYLYVTVITRRNKVQEAFASIDVQLKKRYDLIPNILFIANKFMEHERGLLDDITRLRTEALKLTSGVGDISKKIELDNEIKAKMSQFAVQVENYPQLKSDNTMMQAMATYSEVEEHIAAARRFYNSAVLELNNVVDIFPYSIIAMLMSIKRLPFFEVADEKERGRVDASEFFNK